MAQALALPYTLDRRRVYVFPTSGGGIYMLVIGMMLLGGMNYDNAMAYGLSFLLGAMLLITIIQTWRNLSGLRFFGATTEPVFAGEVAIFHISFDNRHGPERLALQLRPLQRGERWWRRPKQFQACFDAADDSIVHASIEVPAKVRGRLKCPRLLLESSFPLGLIRAWAYLEPDTSCLVYPQPAGRFDLPLDSRDRSGGISRLGSGTEDFAGLRNYQPGDPPRTIAWKALARSDQLEVKRFSGGREREVWLYWAMVEALPSIEVRLQQLCRWVLETERCGIAAGLDIPRTRINPGAGSEHRARCLRSLAEFNLHD